MPGAAGGRLGAIDCRLLDEGGTLVEAAKRVNLQFFIALIPATVN
jgi:hypothetical protein